MKRLVTLISVITACFLGIFLSCQLCEAETALVLNNYDTVYSVNACGDGKIYILSNSGNNFKVTSIDEYANVSETVLDVETDRTAYAYSNGRFCFFRNEYEQNEEEIIRYLSVTEYNCYNGNVSRRMINGAEALISGSFAVDNRGRYYLKRGDSVDIYSDSGSFLRNIGLGSYPSNLTVSSDGNVVYCPTDSGLTIINVRCTAALTAQTAMRWLAAVFSS